MVNQERILMVDKVAPVFSNFSLAVSPIFRTESVLIGYRQATARTYSK